MSFTFIWYEVNDCANYAGAKHFPTRPGSHGWSFPNSISLIERDETSPSVATLQSLAGALNIRMSYFFEEEIPSSKLHIKANAHPKIKTEGVVIEGIISAAYIRFPNLYLYV